MKIKHTLLSVLFLVITAFATKAQSVVLCESYDTQGTASGVYDSWTVTSTASYIYILYNQPTAMKEGSWYIYIDEYDVAQGKYIAYQTIPITPVANSTWYAHDQQFLDAGSFKVSVMFNNTPMAEFKYSIEVTPTTSTSIAGTDTLTTFYHENSLVTAGTSVTAEGLLVGEAETFYLNGNASVTVTIYLDNYLKPILSDFVYVDIFKSPDEEMWDSYTITMQPDWDYLHFKYEFKEPGTYFIDIFNAQDIFINTGTVIIE